MNDRTRSVFRILVGYYGVLQTCHLLSLARAGWFLLQGLEIPFPASGPPGGWSQSALPFLLGMGLADVFAICLGIFFAYRLIFYQDQRFLIGLVSLTAASASGIVYLVGTIPSGAWEANPWEYLAVLVLFSPLIPLYILLLRQSKPQI